MNHKNKASGLSSHLAPLVNWAIVAGLVFVALLLFIALWSYHPDDPAWSHNNIGETRNTLGTLGAWYSDISFSLLGKLSYLIPLALAAFAIQIVVEKTLDKELLSWRLFMLLTGILSGCVLWAAHDLTAINTLSRTGGGYIGQWLFNGLKKSIGSDPIVMVFSLLIFAISISLLFAVPWLKIAEWIGRGISFILATLFANITKARKTRNTGEEKTNGSIRENLRNRVKINKAGSNHRDNEDARSRETTTRPQFTIDRYESNEDIAPDVDKTITNKSEPQGSANDSYRHDMGFVAATQTPEKIKSARKDTTTDKAEPSFFDFGTIKKPEEPTLVEPPASTVRATQAEKANQPLEPVAHKIETRVEKPSNSEAVSDPSVIEPSPELSQSLALDTAADAPLEMVDDVSAEPFSPSHFNRASVSKKAFDFSLNSLDKPAEPVDIIDDFFDESTIDQISELDQIETGLTESKRVISNGDSNRTTRRPQASSSTASGSKASIGQSYRPEEESVKKTNVSSTYENYRLPGIELLDTPPPQVNAYTEDTLAEMAGVLETTLKQFNVEATVMHVSPGPVITRFEIDLAPGIQAKKITNLSQDLARALAVSRVRVEEVITGSSYVGLEVPNKQRQIVYFRDVIRSRAFQETSSPLTVSLGSDTSGKPVVADLMKMPHALVAGTTGSGKSVCINVMLLSMLYKASPKDLRLILVDPKMLEMSMYEDIPHLLTPVITDMNEAENALTWAVGEMERRYQLMAALKVRKIDAFNKLVDQANTKGQVIKDPLWQPDESVGYTHHPNLERLPFIVIVIDELADMMMVVGKQVEQLIARLTQKARAAGIHVVLATQRPSTDVLTGLIKANVPTRIAFQVSSGTDSRVIIDGVGAEKLLGHGDMLYVPPGVSHPQRLHGAFVGDAETDRITHYLRSVGEPDYVEGITRKQDPETLGAFGAADAAGAKEDADPLYEDAVKLVLESGKASISSVQRQLRIGYNRAARMIEDMQEQGIVSEPVNGVRKVLGINN